MKFVLLTVGAILAALAFVACEHVGTARSPAVTVPPNAAETGAVHETIKFSGGRGGMVFQHAKHVDRAKTDCTVCHDKLFPQSVKSALNYGGNRHRTAEAKKQSCAFCHVAGGAAFAAQGNCGRCHAGGRSSSGKRS